MNGKTVLAFCARKVRALASCARKVRALLRRRAAGRASRPIGSAGKIRRRFRFLRWALAVQLLKGAFYAGGCLLAQALLARFFGF